MTSHITAADHDCASEPIRHSGAIQPHGYLICCEMPDWSIRHVSANVDALFDEPAANLLGDSLRNWLTEDLVQSIWDVVHLAEPGAAPVRATVGNVGPSASMFDISVHVADGLVHIELEPHSLRSRDRTPTLVAQSMITRVATSPDMADLFVRAAEQVRALTGHERVVVYRFRADGAGEVVAESRVEALDSMLGLRFPESDIPAQARALYVHNRMRVIPDVDYVPVPILPPVLASGRPLDLSLHHLRSVSPMHLEYSRNMGVLGTMSISIVSGGRLWGLIACHHRRPRAVTATVRAAAELFGMFVSMRVSAHEQQQIADRDAAAHVVQELLWRKLSSTRDLDRALGEELDSLATVLACDGIAVMLGERWRSAGRAPQRPPPALLAWLASAAAGEPLVIATECASDWNTGDAGSSDRSGGEKSADDDAANGLAGLLVIRLGRDDDWLMFFRNEQVEDVRWAGEPAKRIASDGDGRVTIKPRQRFDAWRETIRGRSLPWSDLDRRTAERLRQMLKEFSARAVDSRKDAQEAVQVDRWQATLREQRTRLAQLSTLFEGLGTLDGADAARLSERIAVLEIELRALTEAAAQAVPALSDRLPD